MSGRKVLKNWRWNRFLACSIHTSPLFDDKLSFWEDTTVPRPDLTFMFSALDGGIFEEVSFLSLYESQHKWRIDWKSCSPYLSCLISGTKYLQMSSRTTWSSCRTTLPWTFTSYCQRLSACHQTTLFSNRDTLSIKDLLFKFKVNCCFNTIFISIFKQFYLLNFWKYYSHKKSQMIFCILI